MRLAILVAEDDLLLAADVEDAIRSCGHTCLGPVGSLSEVLRLIAAARVDAAILDISLRHGERVYPAADLLAAGQQTAIVMVSQPGIRFLSFDSISFFPLPPPALQ